MDNGYIALYCKRLRRREVTTQRPFAELNLWQRIFAEHWEEFAASYERENGKAVPENWQENVEKMLGCGDIREGYYEYYCEECGKTKRVGFTCKSKLCLRCFKGAVDDWLNQARKVLFEGVIHRQVVLTVPKQIRPLVLAEPEFMKAYMDSGAKSVKELIEEWRKKRKIRVGIMAVLQLHGRAGNRNPHLHFVVTEGGVDKNNRWQEVKFFHTKKLRKKWQYHVLTGLRNAVRGTKYEKEWYGKLGAMFGMYPTGFDCDCMPEEGPVERLVVYLVKYVSSPPISIRRIESYDGQSVTYRYKDHRKGEVEETLPAVKFIGRMIQHLPPKGFRMVRYYGIYARPVREKIHALVAHALKALVRQAEKVARYFARSPQANQPVAGKYGQKANKTTGEIEERFGKGPMTCPECGSRRMLLVRIWSRRAGVVYDIYRDAPGVPESLERGEKAGTRMKPPTHYEQLALAF